MMGFTGVKDLESSQTHAVGTHSVILNVPRSTISPSETNPHPTSFPINNR